MFLFVLGIWLFGLEGGWLGGLEMGGLGLTDRDEGSNAEAAREMLETGDWISPTLNYEPRFAKPAFTYWLISGSYSLFGINEFAARFPSAVSGLCVLLLQYAFAYRWLGAPLALLSSIMLLLNMEFLAINRMVLTDPELVVCTTLAAYSFWQGLQDSTKTSRWWFVSFYLAIGFGMLVKGPVGIIIPLVGVIPYLLLTGYVSNSWRGLLVSGTSQHDWQIYESDGRPWRDPLLLSPHLVVGPVPMECLSAYRALSIAQTVEGLLEQTGIWHPRAQS